MLFDPQNYTTSDMLLTITVNVRYLMADCNYARILLIYSIVLFAILTAICLINKKLWNIHILGTTRVKLHVILLLDSVPRTNYQGHPG